MKEATEALCLNFCLTSTASSVSLIKRIIDNFFVLTILIQYNVIDDDKLRYLVFWYTFCHCLDSLLTRALTFINVEVNIDNLINYYFNLDSLLKTLWR